MSTSVSNAPSRAMTRFAVVSYTLVNLNSGNIATQENVMGLLDGVLGGVVGAAMVNVVNSVIEKHGGVQGIVKEFETKGLGETVKSWVSTGPNQPISPDQVHSVLGADLLQQLAAKTGLSVDDLKQKLAHVLPTAIDTLTPGGIIPKSA
jgi:uncharacterized protein YidB (DUF937 family)